MFVEKLRGDRLVDPGQIVLAKLCPSQEMAGIANVSRYCAPRVTALDQISHQRVGEQSMLGFINTAGCRYSLGCRFHRVLLKVEAQRLDHIAGIMSSSGPIRPPTAQAK